MISRTLRAAFTTAPGLLETDHDPSTLYMRTAVTECRPECSVRTDYLKSTQQTWTWNVDGVDVCGKDCSHGRKLVVESGEGSVSRLL